MFNSSLFNLSVGGFAGKPAVLSFDLLEGIYGDDSLSVSFLASSGSLPKVVGREANFSFEFEGKQEFFNGMVTNCSAEQAGASMSRATVTIKTIRHSLDKEKKYAVYCESDMEAIIRATLSKAGVSNAKCKLDKFYDVDFKIQYYESDLDFLQRLLEEHRIIEFVKHYKDRSELVISDNGEFTESALNLTKSRLETNESGSFFFGYGHSPLRPGQAFNAFGESFVICSASHSGNQEAAFGLKGKSDGYTCQIAAFSERALNSLPSSKEKPKIPGVIVAKTEGFIGSFAAIDSQGRYIVRMPFDEENEGMTSSLPVHLAQSFAGEGYGIHFPLRKDTPILIAFENGDIDKPIALGAIPKDEHKGPVVGVNSFQNILKTSSGIKFVLNDLTSSLDIEAPNDISIKSEKGIKFGMDSKAGTLKMEAPKNFSVKTGKAKIKLKEAAQGKNASKNKNAPKGCLEIEAPENISIRTSKTRLGLGDSETSINMGAKKNISITASEKLFLKGKKNINITAPGNITIKAGGRLILKGKMVEIN
ncbi:MAG: phage baseplate assembly protein V [Fibromonadaceae bacterium]|jgi:uncharacterized protein involved in type VI secretion and phage assembly|nr:phage baseplate assembly protein V [Fibromonadaceae bacterium]